MEQILKVKILYEYNFYRGQKVFICNVFSSDLTNKGGKGTTEDEKKLIQDI